MVDGTSTPVRSDAAQSPVCTEQNCDELLLTSLRTPQKSGTVIVTVVASFFGGCDPFIGCRPRIGCSLQRRKIDPQNLKMSLLNLTAFGRGLQGTTFKASFGT